MFASVVFDCDSTLTTVEGIEDLAAAHREEVTRLTDAAMRGEVPLEEVYGLRLELVRPSKDAVRRVGARYVASLVADCEETIAALRSEGVLVAILSGGLLPAVAVLASHLGIPPEATAAVAVSFSPGGEYLDFDRSSPLSRSGGKAEVLRRWKPPLPRPLMVVGDGATDLEARSVADRFVAFAGVVARPEVMAGADHVVRAPSLAPILPLALAREPRDPRFRDLWARGLALLARDR